MILLSSIIEKVDIQKADVVKTGLEKKYGPDIGPNTFGVELEYVLPPQEEFEMEEHLHDVVRSLMWKARNDVTARDDYIDWVTDKRSNINRRIKSSDEWDDSYGPIDLDTWETFNPEPEHEDYSDDKEYDDAHSTWDDASSDVKKQYRNWEFGERYNYTEEWAEYMIEADRWESYIDTSDIVKSTTDIEIEAASDYIRKYIRDGVVNGNATNTAWGVGLDGDLMEIRTPPLSGNEDSFKKVRIALSFLNDKDTHGGTSAHVHIGVPEDFDVFDMIAMSDLVDEEKVKQAVGADRQLAKYAETNEVLQRSLEIAIRKILTQNQETKPVSEGKWIMSHDTLKKFILSVMDRYKGTNILPVMKGTHLTIEFRYFSSNVKEHPSVFVQWIKYFLLLPKVAQGRNRVTLNKDKTIPIVLTRLPDNKVRVEFVVRGTQQKPSPMPGLPAKDIRTKKDKDVV